MSTRQAVVTKSIRLAPEESQMLKRISAAEGISEAALMRQFVLKEMAHYRLEQAIAAYRRGEADLSSAARYAGVSVYQMMTELQRRDIAADSASEKFLDDLQALAETFGGSEPLFQAIAEMRRWADDERVLRSQLQHAAEVVFAKLWDNEGDEVWSEYL